MNRLDGKVAIITGAAKGQGAVEAELFVASGAKVVIGDVLEDRANAVAEILGDRAAALRLDVTSPQDWARAVEVANGFGGANVLVNNAAVHWTKPIALETADDLRRMLDINLVGAFLGMQAVLPSMRARGGGSIVNVSSTAGLTGFAYHGAYGASKWALRGMTKTAAVEFGQYGVRVNSVHPGAINTDMLPPVKDAKATDNRFATLPLARAGEPEEIAHLVLFLASDESSYLTGAEFVADGGSTAGPPRAYDWPVDS